MNLPDKIHFVGIGGIGMSGLAEFLHREGHTISGSDIKSSKNTERLKQMGININYEHDIDNVKNAEMIVFSSAIPEDNPEINRNDIPVIKRAEMLNKVANTRKYQIAISGMHGKTTVSSLLTHIFNNAEMDPSAFIGGLLKDTNSNIRYGKSEYCILEADEFDRSFLSIFPSHAIITNIEEEHIDCYDSLKDIKESFIEFANRVEGDQNLVVCIEDNNIKDILTDLDKKPLKYGFSKDSDYQAKDVKITQNGNEFTLVVNNNNKLRIKSSIYGHHNVLNSLACIAMAHSCGLSLNIIKDGVESFTGVQRRLETIFDNKDYTVLDDYAHHPSEVKATISTVKNYKDGRLITIFQPHLYSRTKKFYKDFARELENSDIALVTDIYPAREEPIPGINSEMIVKASNNDSIEFVQKNKLIEKLVKISKPGDVFLTLGAGDIDEIHSELVDYLNQNTSDGTSKKNL